MTESTGSNQFSLMKNRVDVWIEKQGKRSLGAALLVDRKGSGEQAVCQNAGARSERL